MLKSESIAAISAALVEAQAAIKAAPKDKDNPFYKSKYADLATCMEAIREPLHTNSLAICQLPEMVDGQIVVETVLLHKSGEWIGCKLSCRPKDDGPQSAGSAITYLRRYGLAIVGLASEEDDDANAATHSKTPAQRQQVPYKPPVSAPAQPVAAPAAPAPTKPAPVAPPAQKTPAGALSVEGYITGCYEKTWTKGAKSGKYYVIEVTDDNGVMMRSSTFSDSLSMLAAQLQDAHILCKVLYTKTEKGKTCEEIVELAPRQQHDQRQDDGAPLPEQPNPMDELPF